MALRSKGKPNDDVREYIEVLAPLKVTEREAEVARLVAWHFDNAEIADELRISLSTVKSHVGRLLLKLQTENRGVLAGEVRRILREYRDVRDRQRRAKAPNLSLVKRKGAVAPTKRAAGGPGDPPPTLDA